MSSLIKTLPNGITSTTSTESEEKENKMLNFTTNIPELDLENHYLFRAAAILQSLGNSPGLSVNDFYDSLLETDYDRSDHESVTLAAIAI